MAKFNKIPLLSFLACVLTIGGIFGAWVFGADHSSTEVDTDATVETLPEDYWHFNKVNVTFDCVQSYKLDANGDGIQETYTGKFETFNGARTQSFSTGINQCLDYSQYKSKIESLGKPKLFDEASGNELATYAFSHWVYYDDQDDTHFFNFDVAISDSMHLYAQYVPTSNPAIYEVDGGTNELGNLIGYMFVNPSNDGEYIKNNFIVDKDPMNLCPQDGDESNYRNPVYGIRYNNTTYKCVDDGGVDRVYRGSYTVYFKPGTVTNTDWDHFGGNAFFQRQYKFALIGNPIKNWGFSEENAITLGYISTNSSSETQSNVTYKASKVKITDEVWDHDGSDATPDEEYYGFKPYDPYFHLNFHTIKDTSYTDVQLKAGTGVVYSDGTSIDNKPTLDDNIYPANEKECLYDITAVVQYNKKEDYGGYKIYNLYPTSITVSITPCEYTVTYYDESGENVEYREAVGYGATLQAFKTNEFNHKDMGNNDIKPVTHWVDIYTGQSFSAEELKTREMTGNLHLKPVYGDTISPHTTYKYYNGHTADAWTAGITKYLYNTNGLYESLERYTLVSSELTASSDTYDVGDQDKWFDDNFDENKTFYTKDNILSGSIYDGENLKEPGVNNFYVYMTKTSKANAVLPNTTISDDGDYIVYQNVTNSATYSSGDNLYFVNANFVEDLVSPPTSETIDDSGIYMFHVKGKEIKGLQKVENTIYFDTTNPTLGKLFLKPNSNWTQANARFAAYFFGNGDTWVSMTAVSGQTGYYEVTVPTNKTYPSVIFCRMNPSTSTNNWSNKWDQTNDLTIPTNGNNCYTVTEGAWSNGDGKWVFYRVDSKQEQNNGITDAAAQNTKGKTIYLYPGESGQLWNQHGAWFAAYFWNNNGHTWRKMYDLNGDGIYVCDAPSGYSNMLFCRMNPENEELTFNYYSNSQEVSCVWNQTTNLIAPTGEDNDTKFTINDNYYDGEWGPVV